MENDYQAELRFNQIDQTGGDAVVTITEKKAISFVQKTYPEMDGFAALNFFIVNYYAWYVEDEKPCVDCKNKK